MYIYLITFLVLFISIFSSINYNLNNIKFTCKTFRKLNVGPFVLNTNEKFHVFNPSIIMDNNRLLVISRLSSVSNCLPHTNNIYKRNDILNESTNMFKYKDSSSLLLKWYDDSPLDYTIFNNYKTDANNISTLGLEDPRLFHFKNEIWVYAHYRGVQQNTFIHNPIIFPINNPNNIIYLKLDGMSDTEKNWMPFEYNEELYFEYSICPRIIIKCDINTGLCTQIYKQIYINPLNKEVGGGAPSVKIGDIFIGVAHTRENIINNYQKLIIRKNFFYIFQSKPPFNILGMSPVFDIESSNNNIEFVSGLIVKDNSVILSVGIQDCYSILVEYDINEILNNINPIKLIN